ncbi:hypothetical protein IHE45_01G018900 [Dioscorea alata]|uniref:Uncharacterized protein n=5 Tax=Dioscorea alata TaxID=55571 RepID=A0ACB7WT82_DIOAL|nr:hypothetical protein IHE45_01G018900 [Dioscorea alata]KAH7691749.1 hypothetical protein IHE45_01G018900 [Dioscorea alata]KAH7691750.1 hypothetical protein IHE45_01G018900 [Dioscorea alata]KAH7691751.1 hypothetical protein IHE45_01G018900 [Dioscorea alata]KAH7691752.1 hypothetical protein IHE45_01G018900 [Dioscorea alata]
MDVNDPPATESGEQPVRFDPSRMIGIIKRKKLIKDLAAAYHKECMAHCQELLQLQRKWEEQQYVERRAMEETRKQAMRPPKRQRKGT